MGNDTAHPISHLKVNPFNFTFHRYPQSLHFLELLQYEHFRKELMNAQCAKFIDDQQLFHWQHYQRKRARLLQTQAERSGSHTTAASQTGQQVPLGPPQPPVQK